MSEHVQSVEHRLDLRREGPSLTASARRTVRLARSAPGVAELLNPSGGQGRGPLEGCLAAPLSAGDIRVSGGMLTITQTAETQLGARSAALGWEIVSEGPGDTAADLMVTLVEPVEASPDGTSSAVVRVRGLTLGSVEPVPERFSPSMVRWQAEGSLDELRAAVDVPWLSSWLLHGEQGVLPVLRWLLHYVTTLVAAIGAFLLLAQQRRTGEDSAPMAVRALLAAVLLSPLGALAASRGLADPAEGSWAWLHALAVVALGVLVVLVPGVSARMRVLLAALFLSAAVLMAAPWVALRSQLTPGGLESWPFALIAGGAALLTAAVLWAVLRHGTVGLALAIRPSQAGVMTAATHAAPVRLGLIALALVTVWQWAHLGRSAGWLLFYPVALSFEILVTALPLLALAAVVAWLAAYQAEQPTVFLPGRPAKVLALLAFGGTLIQSNVPVLTLPVPVAFVTGLLLLAALARRAALPGIEAQLRQLNPRLDVTSPLVVQHQGQLLQRALLELRLVTREARLSRAFTDDEITEDDYRRRRDALHEERRNVVQGSPDSAVRMALPPEVPPTRLGLAVGPRADWWGNAREAVRWGGLLAALPVGYFLIVLLTRPEGVRSGQFAALRAFTGVAREAVFWLVLALVLGALLAYLPGARAATKGVALGLVYLLAQAVSAVVVEWTGGAAGHAWLFRPLQVLLFLSVLGVLLDVETLRRHGLHPRHVFDYYGTTRIRGAAAYLAPALLSLIAVGQQVVSGNAGQALLEIIRGLPTLTP